MNTRRIHAKAPIRICDVGGWTDTWFARHGRVFNIAVSPCVEVEVGVSGKADLVEYSLITLDDYRRAFPPYLGGEKFLSRQGGLAGSDGKHAVWRDVHSTTSKKDVLWLHRVFALPADSLKNPVLEIHRQGASKKVWVQY